VLLGRPDRDQHGVDAALDRGLDLGPRQVLDEALGDAASLTAAQPDFNGCQTSDIFGLWRARLR
jgi:hypothetical protein